MWILVSDFFEVIWLALKWAGWDFWLPLLAETSGWVEWQMANAGQPWHACSRHRTATGTCCHRLACCSVTSHHCASLTSFVNLRALCSCCSCCSCWLPNPCLAIHNTPLARHSTLCTPCTLSAYFPLRQPTSQAYRRVSPGFLFWKQ